MFNKYKFQLFCTITSEPPIVAEENQTHAGHCRSHNILKNEPLGGLRSPSAFLRSKYVNAGSLIRWVKWFLYSTCNVCFSDFSIFLFPKLPLLPSRPLPPPPPPHPPLPHTHTHTLYPITNIICSLKAHHLAIYSTQTKVRLFWQLEERL